MTGIAVLIMLGLGYAWLTRGFFSALIHLFCTVIAGAVAFAVWEPASYAIMGAAGDGGFLSFLGGTAYGLGLALPFAVCLALLRVAIDKALPANVNPGTTADYAGGAVCGLMSGCISAGIIVISLGFLRMETEFFGATHVGYNNNGNVVRQSGLLVPVDKIVAGLYGRLSEASLLNDANSSLSRLHPNIQEEGASLRVNFGEGRARNTARPEDFKLQSRFTVGDAGNVKLDSLLRDKWNSNSQAVAYTDGNKYPEGSHIEGFVINFAASAKEKEGKTAIGAAQIRMLIESADGSTREDVYPISVASMAESTGDQGFGRWRYDARDTYIASVGASSSAVFAFEFVCPPGYKPIALYVKGARVRLDEGQFATVNDRFTSTAARDAMFIRLGGGKDLGSASGGGESGGGGGGGPVDTSAVVKIGNGQPLAPDATVQAPQGVEINNAIPIVIQKGTHDPLVIDEENKNVLVEGTKVFDSNYDNNTRGLERNLKIERFSIPDDVVIVKVDVSASSKLSILGQAAASVDRIMPPLLFDTNGREYQPVGYFYRDSTKIEIRYTPGQPISALSQCPSLSRSRPDQKLTLIFQVSLGVNLHRFGLGKKALVEFDPPLPLKTRQSNR